MFGKGFLVTVLAVALGVMIGSYAGKKLGI